MADSATTPIEAQVQHWQKNKEHSAQGTEEGEELTEREGVSVMARDEGWQLGGLIP